MDSRTLNELKALRLPRLEGRTFLDVGSGEGLFCGFAHFQGASRVEGVERSEELVNRARQRFPDCAFHHGGWEDLPPGSFDVIVLASGLHNAVDQPALLRSLVDRLSADGTLVLELGVISSRKPQWKSVQRGMDECFFPSMPMLHKVLADYAWKWMGPSVSQDGDPVPRHVIHVTRRRPIAYLLMQPPGYGKSSIASGLFPRAAIQVVSGDHQVGLAAKGRVVVSERLRAAVTKDYSPFHIDQIIQRVFDEGLAGELLALWLDRVGDGDVALDVYVPTTYHAAVEDLLEERGYLPVQLRWERIGQAPLPEASMADRVEAFYLTMLNTSTDLAEGSHRRRWDPTGFVDEIALDHGGQLMIRGWAIDSSGKLPDNICVKLGRRTVPIKNLDRQLRPDVQRHLDLPHGLVGYRVTLFAPEVRAAADLAGCLKVFIPDGITFQLAGDVNMIFRSVGSQSIDEK